MKQVVFPTGLAQQAEASYTTQCITELSFDLCEEIAANDVKLRKLERPDNSLICDYKDTAVDYCQLDILKRFGRCLQIDFIAGLCDYPLLWIIIHHKVTES